MRKAALERILRFMASQVVKKYNPRIVAITGSVGKTSAKEAAFAVLSPRFRTRKNEKNYNNEIGLPLTVIGTESGGRSLARWAVVFLKWAWLMLWPAEYPEILVLEMGADRKGDLAYLTGFLVPTVSVLTEVSSSHLEHFKTIGAVLKEKATVLKVLGEKDLAVMNVDNDQIAKLFSDPARHGIRSNVLSYGFSDKADVRADGVFFSYMDKEDGDPVASRGLSFKLTYKGTAIPIRLNNVLARHDIYAAMAAVSVGIGFGLNLVDIAGSLENFSLPAGRMSLIPGINGSFVIDDTYNASPKSTLAALDVLGEMRAERKVAVLGDMLELGTETESGHRAVADRFFEIKGDIFIGVGKRMETAVDQLKKRGFDPGSIYHFRNPTEAARKAAELAGKGDLILAKGSQGMRMETVVEALMQEKRQAGDLLCRQNRSWKRKPWTDPDAA